MKGLTLREICKAGAKAVDKGDLVIREIDGEGKEGKPLKLKKKRCHLCKKYLPEFDEYAWLIINDENKPDIEELVFCEKSCWKEYMSISLGARK